MAIYATSFPQFLTRSLNRAFTDIFYNDPHFAFGGEPEVHFFSPTIQYTRVGPSSTVLCGPSGCGRQAHLLPFFSNSAQYNRDEVSNDSASSDESDFDYIELSDDEDGVEFVRETRHKRDRDESSSSSEEDDDDSSSDSSDVSSHDEVVVPTSETDLTINNKRAKVDNSMEIDGAAGALSFDWSPKLNLMETDDSFVVEARLPGLSKDNLDLQLESDDAGHTYLTLTVQKTTTHKDESNPNSAFSLQKSYVKVSRSIPLPKKVDKSKISAQWRDEKLEVTVQKEKPVVVEARVTDQVPIDIASTAVVEDASL
jgi:HSP20 family molecular chaperone IbpA